MSVLIVLGLIWTAVLLPPALRARAGRRAEFIDSFREQMGVLEQRNPLGPAAEAVLKDEARPRRRSSPAQRRRDILGGLLGAMIGSLVLGAVPSLRMVWVLHLFLLNTFIGYVSLLAHQRNVALRRARRPAAARSAAPAPAAPVPAKGRAGRVLQPALD